ncbi:MAG: hypothetical protein AB7G34_08090 [Hyphomicrobiales bacterium]
MNGKQLEDILDAARAWPPEDQEELVELAREIEARRHGVYHATAEELAAIDEALKAVKQGQVATGAEVEAVFAKYRRA